jgi:hypothetical protein
MYCLANAYKINCRKPTQLQGGKIDRFSEYCPPNFAFCLLIAAFTHD